MSRKTDADSGSLELLLDTICNTFGGVIFIAILVIVLLQMSSKKQPTLPDTPAKSQLIRSDAEFDRLRAELEITEQLAARQQKAPDMSQDRELVEQILRLKTAAEKLDALTKRRDELIATAAKQQIEINDIVTRAEEAAKELAAAETRHAVAAEALAKEKAARSQTAKLPRLRETRKVEMPMFLRNGRLHSYQVRGAGGKFGFNAAECVQRDAGKLVVPRAGSGAIVDDANRPLLEQRLKQFDPQAHFLAVFVWPESFETFAMLRECFVRAGFEYRLFPVPASQDGVSTSSDPASADFVM